MLRTGLIVDADDLYFSLHEVYGKRPLRYDKYLQKLQGDTTLLTYKIIYSKQQSSEKSTNPVARGFIQALKEMGFECNFGRPRWDVEMALRAADIVPNIDCLVMGSSTASAGVILRWARERGKVVKCFAHKIPSYFSQLGECIEIGEPLLSEPPNGNATEAK